jgi:hypothetical protein
MKVEEERKGKEGYECEGSKGEGGKVKEGRWRKEGRKGRKE